MDFDQPPVVRVEADPERPLAPDRWPADIPAVAQVLRDGLTLAKGVTFLVGENGSGKSTLVEGVAMAYGLGPEGGSTGSQHGTRASESPLSAACGCSAASGRAAGGSSCAPRRCTASTPTWRRTRPRSRRLGSARADLPRDEPRGVVPRGATPPLRHPRLLLSRRARGSAVVHLDPEPDALAARPGRRRRPGALRHPLPRAGRAARRHDRSRSATGGCARPPGRTSTWSGTGDAS